MDYYKWHKGTEAPTEECDCVVVYKLHTTIHKEICRYELSGQKFLFVNQDDNVIADYWVIAWLPIKFPEEVS